MPKRIQNSGRKIVATAHDFCEREKVWGQTNSRPLIAFEKNRERVAAITGRNIILVPYRKQHVPKYHSWMKSEELQKLTASEPLTLEQEYDMQKSWQEDEDKCTFIIMLKEKYDNEIEAMIGDTNIFITDKEKKIGEIEIMIAEQSARGKKLGWEAVILMLLYGVQYIKLKIYEAKISLNNTISIQMFNKLGFHEQSRSEVFQEVTLVKYVTNEWTDWLKHEFPFELQTC